MKEFQQHFDQNYEFLKRNCLNSKTLFEDPVFAADERSIYKKQKFINEEIKWKRPHEFISNPQFLSENITVHSFTQGKLANWYFFFYIIILKIFFTIHFPQVGSYLLLFLFQILPNKLNA
jgi:hypothetical protein